MYGVLTHVTSTNGLASYMLDEHQTPQLLYGGRTHVTRLDEYPSVGRTASSFQTTFSPHVPLGTSRYQALFSCSLIIQLLSALSTRKREKFWKILSAYAARI